MARNLFKHCVSSVAASVEDKSCLERRIHEIGENGENEIAGTRSVVIVWSIFDVMME
jgi:hypothetical protein